MRSPSPAPPMGLLVFASGAAGLVYESLWLRSFGLVFGSTTDATAVVLAAFMGGLSLGSALTARRIVARPLRAYALVELGVASAALLTLPLLRGLPRAYASFDSLRALSGAADVLARGVLASLVLVPATLLLGATIPLAIEFLARRGRDPHAALGRLYLLNTLGGALGVVLGPFLLLPWLGTTGAFLAAAFVSVLVGATAWRFDRELTDVEPSPGAAGRASATPVPSAALADAPAGSTGRGVVLFAGLALASGAFTFGIEVVWTRSLALVLGSSVYAFASMLLAMLLGIAAGTLVYERLRVRPRPEALLGPVWLLGGFLSLATVALLGFLPGAFLGLMRVIPTTFAAHTLAGLGLALLVLLPVTTLLGIGFPLLLHLAGGQGAQRQAGRLYAWNTAGAIAGALAADLLLIGTLGLQGTSMALAGLLLAAGTAALLSRRSGLVTSAAAAGVLLGAAALAPYFRPWNPVSMTSGVYEYGLEWKDRPGFTLSGLARERSLLFYEEGREAVVAVAERGGRRFLSVNGKTDAGSGAEDVLTQRFIAHVPLLLHESPKRVLVVGWGSGASAAAAALYPVEQITCVEIEPATLRAAPLFEELSGHVRRDPRFALVFGDGRSHLLRTGDAYDVIVSEPSNPWITGVSNLFTREFYEMALARLAPQGVFGQWFHYYRFEPEDVKVELRTFAAVFPHVSLWLVPPVPGPDGPSLAADLLLVGSREPVALQWPRLREVFQGPAGEDLRATRAVPDEAALVAAWTLGNETLRSYARSTAAGSGPKLNTDDHPVIELVAPRRNVRARAAIAALAQAQAQAFAEAAGSVEPPLQGLPEADAARFQADLGRRYSDAGQPARALGALERAVRLDPSLEEAQERLSNLALDRRDFARAESALAELVRLRPRDAAAHLRLAAARARQSKWLPAKAALDRAQSLDPKAPVDEALRQFIERQAGAAAGPATAR